MTDQDPISASPYCLLYNFYDRGQRVCYYIKKQPCTDLFFNSDHLPVHYQEE